MAWRFPGNFLGKQRCYRQAIEPFPAERVTFRLDQATPDAVLAHNGPMAQRQFQALGTYWADGADR